MQSTVLTWITFIPLIGMAAILLVPGRNLNLIKLISGVATFIPLVLATLVYFRLFDKGVTGFQLVHEMSWIPSVVEWGRPSALPRN